MKRVAWMIAVGFGCTAMVAAQTSSGQTTAGSQSGANRSSQSGTITVTGCLQRGNSTGATGTTGSTAGTATAGSSTSRSQSGSGSEASFILTNANSGGAMGSSSATGSGSTTATGSSTTGSGSTAGTAGSAAGSGGSMSSTGSTYVLEAGSSQSELTSNVGKRVEVTGTIDSSMSHAGTTSGTSSTGSGTTAGSATGSTGGSGTTGSASGSMSSMSGQHLRVSSVRVVGSDCSSAR